LFLKIVDLQGFFDSNSALFAVTRTHTMIETPMKIRTAVMQLAFDKPVTITLPGMSADDIAEAAVAFGRRKHIGVHASHSADGVILQRVAFTKGVSAYPEMDALKIGDSHLYDLPPPAHQRIRLAASIRGRQGRGMFTCTREGDAIRVTRLPATDAERQACGPAVVPARVTKYDLERLAGVRELRFQVPRAEESRLRMAAHRQAVKTGWPIRCRLQDDGSMLVYRTDLLVTAPAGDSDSREAAPAKA